MSTSSSRDFDAILRNALHAEAGSIEPAAGGLEHITSRLRKPRSLPVAWILHAWSYIALRIPDRDEVTRWVVLVARWVAASVQRMGAAIGPKAVATWRAYERWLPGPGRHGRPSQLGWLRPLVAMTLAVFVVAAGAYAAIDVSQNISPSGAGGNSGGTSPGSGGGHHHGHNNSGGPAGTGTQSPASASTSTTSPKGSKCKTPATKTQKVSNPFPPLTSTPTPLVPIATPTTTPPPTTSPPPSSSSPSTSSSPSPTETPTTSDSTTPSTSGNTTTGPTTGSTGGTTTTASRSGSGSTSVILTAGLQPALGSPPPKSHCSTGSDQAGNPLTSQQGSALGAVHQVGIGLGSGVRISVAELARLAQLPPATAARIH
jgi:outer membrane biosynthesis protein TonB